MNNRTCSIDGCERKHQARGLCGSHYNQTHVTVRHKKRTVPCAYCGKDVVGSGGGGRKYGAACSTQCREWLNRPYCVLPADHWARWWGKTSPWSPPKQPLTITECKWCGIEFMPTRAGTKNCSRRCLARSMKARRRAKEHLAPGEYTWVQVIRLHLLAGRQCSYCDTITTQPEPDHVVPISRGGRNDIGNILPCCSLCNADKGDMTLTEWAEWRATYGKQPVRTEFDWREKRFVHLMLGEATGESWRVRQLAEKNVG